MDKIKNLNNYQLILLILLSFMLVSMLIPIAAFSIGALLTESISIEWKSTLIVVLISLIATVALGYFILQKFLSPLEKISKWSTGDKSQPIFAEQKNPIGRIVTDVIGQSSYEKEDRKGMDFKEEIMHLSHQTAEASLQLKTTTEETSNATEEISSSVQDISSGAERQFQAIQDINNNSSAIFFTLTEISESIKFIKNTSGNALANSNNGKQLVEKITNQMNTIQERVNRSVQVVNQLGQKSNEIGNILSLITDISNQTNLLALNAAIEAARAGEHGRGFSVVADEVRKLAEQTNHATGNIQELIDEINKETTQVVSVIKDSGDSVEEGITLSSEAGSVFTELYGNNDELAEIISDILVAINEVTTSMDTVSNSIEHVSEITNTSSGNLQNIAAVIEELTASMEEISTSARMLSGVSNSLQNKLGA
ncbi:MULTISPECIES: methyl-accepting chemotaxis protein [Bacillus]|uniref:Methyl-accepting chemotaxis protein n=2 Tax=Bacillus capparidis TaxID=1840411 RepID=A0ABS4D0F0_9BACI|nr:MULTISPECIES: methyl-accepting chemotaxis protein [Bacillus]MBP1083106.1 methyl-accepting chemotaxis protein [Bacillus capparidis]MED1097943.1 methyl-accepting chemotaxis protein [Bacillus capparidis]